jgi:thioredoxin reductase
MVSDNTDIAIVGAGPYGLSIAAHLGARALDYRIIGDPMQFWHAHMPKGMQLKSEGFASSLFDPDKQFSLERYCKAQNIPYANVGIPVAVETFTAYGMAFQKRFAPNISTERVIEINRSPRGFQLHFKNGKSLLTRNVVLAIGINDFRHIPSELKTLPPSFLSHASEHADLSVFKGRNVTVVGAGASAIDIATLLHESGAFARLVSRKPLIKFHGKMELTRSPLARLRRPLSGIGPGWRYVLFTDMPQLVHHLPEAVRRTLVERVLGPAGGWFVKDRFAAVPTFAGYRVKSADMSPQQDVQLRLVNDDGTERLLETEHVIAATGYKVDLADLSFLGPELRSQVQTACGYPVLSSHFESSVPGLYFAGAASALGFGPVMRFAVGAGFTARRLANRFG